MNTIIVQNILELIKKTTAIEFEITPDSIQTKRTTEDITLPKQVAHWAARQLTPYSYATIGRTIGSNDHATVLHNVKVIENYRSVNKPFKAKTDILLELITDKLDNMAANFEIFIPGNVPSSKNGKIWTGKSLIWSKSAQAYKAQTEPIWKASAPAFREAISILALPLKVKFKFIRGTAHKFDYVNPLQTVLDLMVMYEWITDDNADIILPVFEPYEYDKGNPGVIIKTSI